MRRIAHLARRFFGSWRVHRPGPDAQRLISEVLSAAEAEAFWDQPVPDLAHALRAAETVLQRQSGRTDLARAALLHDIGKRRSRLGTIGRSMATALSMARVPLRGRYRSYADHAEIGARELEELGCETLVVDFARHHHGERPRGFDEGAWAALIAADNE